MSKQSLQDLIEYRRRLLDVAVTHAKEVGYIPYLCLPLGSQANRISLEWVNATMYDVYARDASRVLVPYAQFHAQEVLAMFFFVDNGTPYEEVKRRLKC